MPYPVSVQVAPTATFIFFGSRTRFMQLHLFCRIFLQIPRCIIPANADNIADIAIEHFAYANKHLQRNIFIPTEVRHCVRRKLSCPTQIRLAHFFVHKGFPMFVIAYVHGSIPLLCCFIVSAFVLFLPTFRHLFISGLVLCFSIEQNSRIQLHFGPPKNSALTQKPRFCLRCLKRMRIFSAFFFEQPLNLIDNRKILFR